MLTELLAHGNDGVVRAMSGALRNLAIDVRNKDLLGESVGKARGVGEEGESGRAQPARVLPQGNTRCLIWWATCPAGGRVSRCERSRRRRWCLCSARSWR